MTPAAPHRKIPWQSMALAALSLLLVAWFLRGIDRHQLGQALANAHPDGVAMCVAVTLMTYTFRAWRWQALLAPIGGVSFRNAFRITVMGFTATNLLPGRLGEFLRPYLVSRVEHVAAPAAFATIVIERLLDLCCVLGLFGVFLLTSTIDVGPELKAVGAAAAGGSVAALTALAIGASRPEVLRRWADAGANWLPGRVRDVARRFVHTLVDGLAVLRQPGPFLVAALMSLGLWLSIALGVWYASRALDLTMAFSSSFLVILYLVVGVAVPVPAGVGSFHFMYQLVATSFLGASRPQAAAAAIVLHAVSIVPISLLGLVFLAQDGWTLARLRGVKSDGGLK